MRIRTFEHSLAKTLSFAVIHLAIAVTLGWLVTGAFVLGGLLALVEPLLNTVIGHKLEALVPRIRGSEKRRRLVKSALLGVSHLAVAILVGWWLSNSFVAASVYAVAEPLANAVAFYFFEKWWDAGRSAPRAVAA